MTTGTSRAEEVAMDLAKLGEFQRTVRSNVRAFLLVASRAELEREQQISRERGDQFRAACVQELLDES
jgi:hypothetical protein